MSVVQLLTCCHRGCVNSRLLLQFRDSLLKPTTLFLPCAIMLGRDAIQVLNQLGQASTLGLDSAEIGL